MNLRLPVLVLLAIWALVPFVDPLTAGASHALQLVYDGFVFATGAALFLVAIIWWVTAWNRIDAVRPSNVPAALTVVLFLVPIINAAALWFARDAWRRAGGPTPIWFFPWWALYATYQLWWFLELATRVPGPPAMVYAGLNAIVVVGWYGFVLGLEAQVEENRQPLPPLPV